MCTRVYVCARRCVRIDIVPRAPAAGETDETRQLAPTRDREIQQSISQVSKCVFARARSRGLSRSQPVFVIIMLEKCMNICVLLMLLLISSLSMIKEKKSETELPETRYNPL